MREFDFLGRSEVFEIIGDEDEASTDNLDGDMMSGGGSPSSEPYEPFIDYPDDEAEVFLSKTNLLVFSPKRLFFVCLKTNPDILKNVDCLSCVVFVIVWIRFLWFSTLIIYINHCT